MTQATPLNMMTIYFFYGLSFFLLGVVILCTNDRKSYFKLSKIFWLLALFGLIHGTHEWLEILLLIGKDQFSIQFNKILSYTLFITTLLSFYFLLCFGVLAFVIDKINNLKKILWINFFIFVLITIISNILIFNDSLSLLKNTNIFMRYFIGFPGALLTGLSFIYWSFKSDHYSKLTIFGFWGMAISMILYSVLTGIVVPKSSFFPANFINYETFISTIGVSVQFCRMLIAVFSIIFILLILNIFKIETAKIRENALLKKHYISLIYALAKSVEEYVPLHKEHHKKLNQLTKAIATEMNLSEFQILTLNLASYIYDIGKLLISKELFIKQKKLLRKEEYKILELYPTYSYEILKDLNLPWPLAKIARNHHEYLDGTGYPRGISEKDEKFLLETQIISLAVDFITALSNQPTTSNFDAGIELITKYKNTRYNAKVVDACMKLFLNLGFKFN